MGLAAPAEDEHLRAGLSTLEDAQGGFLAFREMAVFLVVAHHQPEDAYTRFLSTLQLGRCQGAQVGGFTRARARDAGGRYPPHPPASPGGLIYPWSSDLSLICGRTDFVDPLTPSRRMFPSQA